jgi:S-adenosylmethionine decarboxylase
LFIAEESISDQKIKVTSLKRTHCNQDFGDQEVKPLGQVICMEFCGTHLLVEFSACCNTELLDDVQQIEDVLRKGLEVANFTLVKLFSHKFYPIGVTSVAIVSESHVSIHTYPETGHASIDIYHCSDGSLPLLHLMEYLKQHFDPCESRYAEVVRGRALRISVSHPAYINEMIA